MSRSGYSDDLDPLELGRWRGAVKSAIRGKRGQRLLRDLVAALDAMEDKRLAAGVFEREDGCACALAVVGRGRGLDVVGLDPERPEDISRVFDVASALVQEVMYINDEVATSPTDPVFEGGYHEGPAGDRVWGASFMAVPAQERLNYRWVPHAQRLPTDAEVERRERDRWKHVRTWAAENIRTEELST